MYKILVALPASAVRPISVEGVGARSRQPRSARLVLCALLVAGLVVFLPSVRSQFLLDDYLHVSMIDGSFPTPRGPLDLYNFVDEPEHGLMVNRGMLPWWSHPRLRIRFLRPLPSVLRWTEQRLFGRSPVPPHLHSFLWWFAAVVAARRLYARHFPARPALLATIIFALSPCHALPIAWLANREALVSLTFGIWALSSYLRWRESGGAAHAAAAAALFSASMAGGEYAFCVGGYVLAFELSQRGGLQIGRRVLGVALYAVPAAAYLGLRAALGYGTQGSSFYNDPLQDPLAYLHAAPRRLAALLAQEWFTLDADDSASTWKLGALVAGGAAVVFVPLRRTFAALDPRVGRRARGMLIGSLFALIPVLAVDPSPRVLGAAVLGVAPAFGLLLDQAWFPEVQPERRGAAEVTGLAALAIGFAQFVHGPAMAWLIGEHYRRTSKDFVANVAKVRALMNDARATELYVLRGGPSSFFLPFALAQIGPLPARWRVLSTTGDVLALRRDVRTLELVVPKGHSMFSWFSWDLFRDTNSTVHPGQVFDTPGLRTTVLEVGSEGPRKVKFEIDRDVEAPEHLWITESLNGAFPEAHLPKIGFGQPFEP